MDHGSASVLASLRRWELAAHRRRAAVSRELGISDDELLLLLQLAEHDGATQAQLAAFVGLSRSGAGAMIQRLEAAGVVERRPAASDRRLRLVDLTARARRQLAAAFAEQEAAAERVLARCPPEERRAVSWVLGALADASELALAPAEEAAPDAAGSPWRLWA
jgi:DNA-binding MarR family transcriptional regulator